jgi:hypothetical protein
MKNRLLTFASAIALVAVAGHFYARPLLAQVRAAFVKNIDERGRTPYQQRVVCDGINGGCNAVLPPVPPHTRLVVEYVAASLVIDNGQPRLFMTAAPNNANIPFNPVFQQGNQYVATQPMIAFFEAGQSPTVVLTNDFAGGLVSLDGVVTGYLVDLSL